MRLSPFQGLDFVVLTQGEGAKNAPSPWAAFFCPFGAVGPDKRPALLNSAALEWQKDVTDVTARM
jgi:hypothetical protein